VEGTTPGLVDALSQVRAIGTGEAFGCALAGQNVLTCWGTNSKGERGNAAFANSASPSVAPLGDIAAFATGGFTSCAITTAGTGFCWGNNAFGQLGAGTASQLAQPVPQAITSLH